MATVNIGSLKFNWKGNYNGSTAYAIDDVTEYNGSSYICILASTGNLPTNTTYFQPMATKGTDGTDVGSTLTTQGDILYRDGSGLQRLPKGTAGQVLQMNTGATAPEYGNVSSDFVKIAEFSHSGSNVTNFNMDNIFSATYPVYKVYLTGLLHSSTGASGWIRVIKSDGSISTSNSYEYASEGRTSGSSGLDICSTSASHFQVSNDLSSDNEKTSSFEFTIYRPYQTTEHKHISWHANTYCNNSSNSRYFIGGGHWKTYGTAIRGLNYSGQGNSDKVTLAKAVVYGLKGAY